MRFFGLISIPHVLRDTTDEVFRLIGRIVRHSEHATRLHIDAHERCRGSCSALHELAQRCISDILNRSGDREIDVVALGRIGFAHDLLDLAGSIGDERALTVVARKHVVIRLLNTRLADRIAHLDIASFSNILQIFFRRSTCITEHMSGKSTVGVDAIGTNLRGYARKGITVFIDVGHVAQTHVLCDHALRLSTGGGIEDTRTHHIVGNAQQSRKTQDDIRVVRNISIGKHGLHLAIRYQRHAIAIIDHPTRRRSTHGGVEIRFSFALVACRTHHLQAEKLHGKRTEGSRNDDPDRKETIALGIGRTR